jgi:hypothetical protein
MPQHLAENWCALGRRNFVAIDSVFGRDSHSEPDRNARAGISIKMGVVVRFG